jgi:hypothetical protein
VPRERQNVRREQLKHLARTKRKTKPFSLTRVNYEQQVAKVNNYLDRAREKSELVLESIIANHARKSIGSLYSCCVPPSRRDSPCAAFAAAVSPYPSCARAQVIDNYESRSKQENEIIYAVGGHGDRRGAIPHPDHGSHVRTSI